MRTVSLFGTGLFVAAVAVQAVLAGTAIWYMRLFQSSAAINAIGAFSVLALSGIVPPLAAFIIGDRSTRPRSRYEHFYNGTLFAFMAIWLNMFIALFIAPRVTGFIKP